jgi:argininosuccinate lyase
MTLWSGRLESGMAEDMAAFTSSLAFDRELWRVDVAGSVAHVEGLRRVGLLTDEEASALRTALRTAASELEDATFTFAPTDEDIHTAVERRVTELAGPTGAKLHTGRSRNDQVATDLRLWAREAIVAMGGSLLELADALDGRAEELADTWLPGYTHLQRAQPVLLSHHLRAHAWALLRDVDRLCDAARRVDVSPLGAGALAGSSLPLDPAVAAGALSFGSTFDNSLDAVSDRDFVAELLFCVAMSGVHLSRMGEELVVWSSTEFGFIVLDDRYTTGSSMLPQKKNPDAAELARGKAGRLIGHLTGFLATLKGLPLSYNKDLQEDKEPLFDAVAQLLGSLATLRGCYATARFGLEAMDRAAADELLGAVDLAEWLVARGTPFRDAHRRVGALVATALREGRTLRDVVELDDALGPAAAELLGAGAGAASRRGSTPGGGGPTAQAAQAVALRLAIDAARRRVAELPRLPAPW